VSLSLLLLPATARAERVFFVQPGRSLHVKTHRIEGSSLVLVLDNNGEIVCNPELVTRIAPDEVPYPDPTDMSPAPPVSAVTPTTRTIGDLIDTVAVRQGVPAKLVRALIQIESGYNERARSPKGAMGLMQLMPETAQRYAVSDPYNPKANIEAGISHLKSLLERFPLALALAAYNAGESAVERYGGMPPYPETRDYVARILRLVARSSH
jgi:hypothetical protein